MHRLAVKAEVLERETRKVNKPPLVDNVISLAEARLKLALIHLGSHSFKTASLCFIQAVEGIPPEKTKHKQDILATAIAAFRNEIVRMENAAYDYLDKRYELKLAEHGMVFQKREPVLSERRKANRCLEKIREAEAAIRRLEEYAETKEIRISSGLIMMVSEVLGNHDLPK